MTDDTRPILIANPGADLYGSDRMVLETVSALVASGERVVVSLPHDGPLVAELAARGAEVETTPTAIIRKSALRPIGMVGLIKDAVAGIWPGLALLRRLRPRVVLVNTITPPLWLVLARLLGIPTICHVHEGESSAPPLLRKALAAPLLLSCRLIVNSNFSLGVLTSAIPALHARSAVVYNAVAGPPTDRSPRATLTGPVRLLYIGRLSPRKGPDVAIRAVEVLAQRGVDATLDLVGAVFPGYEWFEKQLHDQVAAAALGERIRFHGFHRDVWPYAAESDISLIPSTIDEPFGNTAVEAALAGRPSVVSRTSGLIEASSAFQSSIHVVPGSAEAIADAVQKISGDWETYAELATRDSQVARSRYGRDGYRSSITKVLAEVSR